MGESAHHSYVCTIIETLQKELVSKKGEFIPR